MKNYCVVHDFCFSLSKHYYTLKISVQTYKAIFEKLIEYIVGQLVDFGFSWGALKQIMDQILHITIQKIVN